jgi:hypothetical protein
MLGFLLEAHRHLVLTSSLLSLPANHHPHQHAEVEVLKEKLF